MTNIVDMEDIVDMKNIANIMENSNLENLLQAAGEYVETNFVNINKIANDQHRWHERHSWYQNSKTCYKPLAETEQLTFPLLRFALWGNTCKHRGVDEWWYHMI